MPSPGRASCSFHNETSMFLSTLKGQERLGWRSNTLTRTALGCGLSQKLRGSGTMSDTDRMDIDSEESPVAQQPDKRKKFEIKKWTAVAFWSWDIAVDNCAICRNHIMEPCIECQPKAMTDTDNECVAAWGTCGHAFHLHCINKWIKTRDACPLDNQPWQLARCGR